MDRRPQDPRPPADLRPKGARDSKESEGRPPRSEEGFRPALYPSPATGSKVYLRAVGNLG